jgi:hypothetical protein
VSSTVPGLRNTVLQLFVESLQESSGVPAQNYLFRIESSGSTLQGVKSLLLDLASDGWHRLQTNVSSRVLLVLPWQLVARLLGSQLVDCFTDFV